jgi:hypothetical protein
MIFYEDFELESRRLEFDMVEEVESIDMTGFKAPENSIEV